MGGRPVLNEDLVNLPNWLVLKLRIEGEEAIGSTTSSCSTTATSSTSATRWCRATLRFRDRAGRETTLRSRRFVSMAHVHQAGIEWTLTPENWSGRVEVVSALDGRVTNRGVARYRQLEGRHLDPVSPRTFGPEVIALKVRDPPVEPLHRRGRPHARVSWRRGARRSSASLYQMRGLHPAGARVRRQQGEPVRVEKMVAFYTSRDRAISEPLEQRRQVRRPVSSFAEALDRHARAWDELWRVCDMELAGERAGAAAPALPHRPHPAGLLAPHGRPRRGRPGARAQRRGLPRARLLGRALRLSVPELPAAARSRASC